VSCKTQDDLYAKSLNIGSPSGTHYHVIGSDGKLNQPNAPIVGSRFSVVTPLVAAADVGKPLFIAGAPCKLVSAYETHVTVCDAGDTMTLEKCNTGEAPGAGEVMLASAWTLNSTANTPIRKDAVTDGKEVMVAGDSIMAKFATGDGTNYAGACVTLLLEWT